MIPRFSRSWALAAALVCLTATGAAAASKVVPASQVTVAATTGDALVIWDATVMINGFQTQKVPDATAMTQLKATAGKLLIEKAKGFTPAAKTVTVRVMYAATPLAEVYRTATFNGFEKLLLVTASRADAVAKADAWDAALAKNTIPPGMTVTVAGQLPKP